MLLRGNFGSGLDTEAGGEVQSTCCYVRHSFYGYFSVAWPFKSADCLFEV